MVSSEHSHRGWRFIKLDGGQSRFLATVGRSRCRARARRTRFNPARGTCSSVTTCSPSGARCYGARTIGWAARCKLVADGFSSPSLVNLTGQLSTLPTSASAQAHAAAKAGSRDGRRRGSKPPVRREAAGWSCAGDIDRAGLEPRAPKRRLCCAARLVGAAHSTRSGMSRGLYQTAPEHSSIEYAVDRERRWHRSRFLEHTDLISRA